MQTLSDDDAMDAVWEKHMNPPRPTVARVRIKSVTMPRAKWPHAVSSEVFDQIFIENGTKALARIRKSFLQPKDGDETIRFVRCA